MPTTLHTQRRSTEEFQMTLAGFELKISRLDAVNMRPKLVRVYILKSRARIIVIARESGVQ